MAGRRNDNSFLKSVVRNIANTQLQPREGLVQILDLPTNLTDIINPGGLVGVQLPVYDGVHFCHAFFKKKAKATLKSFLEINLPALRGSHTGQDHPKANAFSRTSEYSTFCSPEMEEDFVMFCKVTKWRLITRLDSVFTHSAQFILVIEAAEMSHEIASHALLAGRLFNSRFPVFARRDKDFYDSKRFLVNFVDHACVANGERNLHSDPSVKSVAFKLLNAWKHAGVAVQMTSMDEETQGAKRVRPFVWCPASYVELTPYKSEEELVMQMGRHIYKLARSSLDELNRDGGVDGRTVEVASVASARDTDSSLQPVLPPEGQTTVPPADGVMDTREGGVTLNDFHENSSAITTTMAPAATAAMTGPTWAFTTPPITTSPVTTFTSSTTTSPVTTFTSSTTTTTTGGEFWLRLISGGLLPLIGATTTTTTTASLVKTTASPVTTLPTATMPTSSFATTASLTKTANTASLTTATKTTGTKFPVMTSSDSDGQAASKQRISIRPNPEKSKPAKVASNDAMSSLDVTLSRQSANVTAGSSSTSAPSILTDSVVSTSATATPESVLLAKERTLPFSPSVTLNEEVPMNFTFDTEKANLDGMVPRLTDEASFLSSPKSIVSIEELLVIEEIVDNDDDVADGGGDQHPLSTVVGPQANDSSFFTAESSPMSADGRLSAFMSEDDSTGDDQDGSLVASPLPIEALSSQEFMSRIAFNAGKTSGKELTEIEEEESYETAVSMMGGVESDETRPNLTASSNLFRDETSRLRSLSQSSAGRQRESQRLSKLRSPSRSDDETGEDTIQLDSGAPATTTTTTTTTEEDQPAEDCVSTLSALNFTFHLEDADDENEDEQNDDSFETISQMELAGVSSIYAIKTKGSPKRSPAKKSPRRTDQSPDKGDDKGGSRAKQEKLLGVVTPRRAIRDPLQRSYTASSEADSTPSPSPTAPTRPSAPRSRLAGVDLLPSQLDIDEALNFIRRESQDSTTSTVDVQTSKTTVNKKKRLNFSDENLLRKSGDS